MKKIIIYFASYSSNTDVATEVLLNKLSASDEVSVIRKKISDFDVNEVDDYDLIILASPSWFVDGKQGQPHEDFFALLNSEEVEWIKGKRFAVFGLGDKTYREFCGCVDVLESFVNENGGEILLDSIKLNNYLFSAEFSDKLIVDWVIELFEKLGIIIPSNLDVEDKHEKKQKKLSIDLKISRSENSFLWKMGAPAGMGVMVTGLSMAKFASRSGMSVFAYSEYPSLVRGGHNTIELNIGQEKVSASKKNIDCLVCVNQDTFDLHSQRLTKNSLVIYDPEEVKVDAGLSRVRIPVSKIIEKLEASKVMSNTVLLGASVALMGGKFEDLEGLIADQFANKQEKIITMNVDCAREGYEFVGQHYQYFIV